MNSFGNSFSMGQFNIQTIMKTNDLTPQIQKHLMNVFGLLSATVAMAAFGVWFTIAMGLLGSSQWAGLGCLGLMLYLVFTQESPQTRTTRMAVLLAFGFLKGMTISGLVYVALDVDPSIVITAFLGTVAIFVCFSGAALVAKRRSYFYLAGILSSATSLLLLTSIAGMFFFSNLAFAMNLYVGLLVFCGYVVLDTQMLVEKAAYGQCDIVKDALNLFVDFVAIFVRILIILLKNSEKKDKKRRN
uniref:Bax inhibitor 1 n=1 Tax=Fibrocapsa japonica TaxID=94617 RepID=A0A7S2UVY9_9STRA|mmetsp:Transcript_13680/g.20113  ORF Transcript_13680/g.20113 Transcript_13680/m.20113 type:complete len:244 (+) Transcript_13680:111-842(+)|eukprot:CAMPEP_0113935180 /NCGR_PEP_ID=MMETSP1339-20121228/2381_1 /TAXON_ID=94617 /ORGANISM="Fibrocapsa japonica" /LENGTH=243 /DNA_ID=CAMNT_0000937241 /DNA_START=109 /DNA_END=840 /DNA_ORIENTATION=- /assembly_acc=CAM_ASM_000762